MNETKSNLRVDTDVDHIKGSPDSPTIFIEYGDYECEQCRQAHVIVKNLYNKFGKDMCYIFRNFPLPQKHVQAEMAAQAAEAAAVHHKFWSMHNCLFEAPSVEKKQILMCARKVGLDTDQLVDDLKIGRFRPRIERDFSSGLSNGVHTTPTFFINGVKFRGSHFALDELFNSFYD